MSPDDPAERAAVYLGKVAASLPGGGEDRPGQAEMARAVASAIQEDRHLVVQAGTGTGKSLAYLVPAILSGRKVVVATATKALQDQLAGKDLPMLSDALGERFSFSVLKGRSNYLCLQRVREVSGKQDAGAIQQMTIGSVRDTSEDESDADEPDIDDDLFSGGSSSGLAGELRQLLSWADTTRSGDRAELEFEPSPRAWSALSVTSRECPGSSKCPSGEGCYTENARLRASASDVVVVNTHLYGSHLASGGGVLPAHDVVVFDEAHQLEDIATACLGIELSAGSLRSLARQARSVLGKPGVEQTDALVAAGEALQASLASSIGKMLPSDLGTEVGGSVSIVAEKLSQLASALRAAPSSGSGEQGSMEVADGDSGGEPAPARQRAIQSTLNLAEEVSKLRSGDESQVRWVEGPEDFPTLRSAPIEIGPALVSSLWPDVSAILTSATIPPGMERRLGLGGDTQSIDVGSPFEYRENAILYCASHLPDPRSAEFPTSAAAELVALINAARGRTMALFTSWKGMQAAVEQVRGQVPYRVLAQGDMPKPALTEAFSEDESSCLFATMSFWQGVDVPGSALSMVVIDKLPFSRPDEPLMVARRERAGSEAFYMVDLPRAATLLAQGAGRLIRSATDRGVVAVLDPRLAKAGYRNAILKALPPMKRSIDIAEVEKFFADR